VALLLSPCQSPEMIDAVKALVARAFQVRRRRTPIKLSPGCSLPDKTIN
jgi:hypothetical protein